MNRLFATAVLALGCIGAAQAADLAPKFSLPTAAGTIELESLRGKTVYVDFWASWCGPCRQSFPWMNEMRRRYADKGLVIVTINLDKDRKPADLFLTEYPAEFIVAYDPAGDTARAYQVKGMPSSYLIDRAGYIQYRHIGFRTAATEDMESRIKSSLAQ